MFCCTLSKLLSRYYCGTNWMLSVPFHFTRWPKLLCVSFVFFTRWSSPALVKIVPGANFRHSWQLSLWKATRWRFEDCHHEILFFRSIWSCHIKEPFVTSIPSKQWSSFWPASSHIQPFIFNAEKISIIKLTTITIITTFTTSLKMILLALSLSMLSTVSATTTTMSGVTML